jgi:hypothetical protein
VTNLSGLLIQAHAGKGLVQVVPFQPPVKSTTGQNQPTSAIISTAQAIKGTGTGQQVAAQQNTAAAQQNTAAAQQNTAVIGLADDGATASAAKESIPTKTEEEAPVESTQADSMILPPGTTEETAPIGTGAAQQSTTAAQQSTTAAQQSTTAAQHSAAAAEQNRPAAPVQMASPAPGESQDSKKRPGGFLVLLVSFGDALGKFFQRIGRGLGKFLARLFPEELLEISNTAMAVIAIAVPVIIVAAASVVYLQLGRAEQGRQFYLQANNAAANALTLQDPLAQRQEFQAAEGYLEQAEAYGGVPPARLDELQERLNLELDRLDHVLRIEYRQALLEPLDPAARITRLVVAFDDLYMLDSTSNRVLHAVETLQGYELDAEFQCGSEFAGGGIGTLIGISSWPEGFEPRASIMGMDQVGNLIFCEPGFPPEVRRLASPPDTKLKNVTVQTMDRGSLYVLDPPSNALWVYPGSQIDLEPTPFFGDEIPPLKPVVDLAANLQEIYLLYADGHLALCFDAVPGISQPKCTNPQPFKDFREGRENADFIPDNPFTQILSNPSPDPSLFLLEPENQAITQFSFRSLGFLHEYRPVRKLEGGAATGFAIRGVDRLVYIATGNQVYFGVIP